MRLHTHAPPIGDTFTVPTKLKDRAEVLTALSLDIEEWFNHEVYLADALWVFVEHPLVGRAGAHATIVQAQVQGVVLAEAIKAGAKAAYTVNVSSWKKTVVGNGSATKDHVAAWLAETHPVLAALAGTDQDLVDAACVALYGYDVIERGVGFSGV
jgi:Holliday junction resolvasome RuvABC endonuclease subunit